MQLANSTQSNKIDPHSLSLSELIFYFRQLGYEDFKKFQRSLYDGELELYLEEEEND